MELSITEISEADKEALRKLYTAVRQNSFYWLDNALLQTSSFDKDTEGEYILVARNKRKVVGFIAVWLPDNFIHHLYVDVNYQGKGVGIQLLNKVIPRLSTVISLKCLKKNALAIQFYKNKGWNPKSEGTADDGDYILFEFLKS